ncbi:MAG TPA: DUF5667 domain-containing protein [Glycomyces sp.]|nr:DUF5667 domain-containing protein [Glycomyces sp.]
MSTETFGELVGVAERLHDLGEQMNAAATPSADWRDATRRRLMAVAADEGIGATARHRASASVPDTEKPPVLDEIFPRRPRGGRRLAIVAALLTGTVAVSGVSAASGNALPGDTLYNVKRSTERAQLALAGNDLGRAQLHLEFAGTRIEEAAALDDESDTANALNDAASELRSGAALLGELAVESGEAAPLDYIDLFTNEHRWTLEELVSGLDGEALGAGEDLLVLVENAALRSVELRSALDCTESGGPTDELGPIPAGCEAADGPAESAEPSEQEPDDASTGGSGTTESETADSPETPSTAPSSPGPGSASPGVVGDVTDPLTDAASELAPGEDSGDEPRQETEGGVLDELSGIVKDLFG